MFIGAITHNDLKVKLRSKTQVERDLLLRKVITIQAQAWRSATTNWEPRSLPSLLRNQKLRDLGAVSRF